MKIKKIYIVIILFNLIFEYSCTPAAQPANTTLVQEITPIAIIATATPIPTNTFIPTETVTPRPTKTPNPTYTPWFTSTPPNPREPVILTGTGDSVEVVDWSGPGLLHITYTGPLGFTVDCYDANNKLTNWSVFTIGDYEGTRPFDFFDYQDTTHIKVTAHGNWEIQILPLNRIRRVEIPGTFTGIGDDVVAFMGSGIPDQLVVDASTAKDNFFVISYSDTIDVLVNERAPYTGTVMINERAIILQVIAVGDWSVNVITK
jgi:hypothetical protein